MRSTFGVIQVKEAEKKIRRLPEEAAVEEADA
jgi:hypothetical protein